MRKSAEALVVVIVLSAGTLAAQERGAERAVGEVHFKGNRSLDDLTLAAAISTSSSSQLYQLFGVGDSKRWDETEFRRDVFRLQLLYRQHGYYEARVDTAVDRRDNLVDVDFIIVEGPPVLVDSLGMTGLDSVRDSSRLASKIPLRVGRPFDRILFEMSADSIAQHARDRGHPYAMVFRNYRVDRRARVADVSYDVLPGPHARIGEIVIVGNSQVSERTIRRALVVHPGDEYRREQLYESQRGLYQTELFRYVSVGIDRDSAVGGVDSLVRLRVQLAEATPWQLRAGAGYGTIDCFRTSGTATRVNFLGEARRLDIVGRLSKLGVGSPLTLENNVCRELENDPFSLQLNYLGSVTVTQPSFIFQRTATSVSLFAEKRSEFNAYLYNSFGGVLGFKFGFGRDVPISLNYRLSQDQTDADPATYCIYFDQCDPASIALLSSPQRLGTLTLSIVNRRTDSPIQPTRGHVWTLELMTASPLIGSQIVFDRFVAEAVGYAPWRGRFLSARLRGGMIRQGESNIGGTSLQYVPPDSRFYAGGPNTVRGYERNEMGPVVYVADSLTDSDGAAGPAAPVYHGIRYSPTGSSAIILANVEARMPTPLFAGRISFSVFVDGGELWDYRRDSTGHGTWQPGGFKITPGVGLQIFTPLGPMRLDAAYNAYHPQAGPLYLITTDPITQEKLLVEQPGGFSGGERGKTFLSRIQFHFSVGLAF